MGIKGLNHFLKSTCFRNIREISLEELRYKTVVIDTSIYMYRFKCDDILIEGMYQIITQFKYYNITPVFIFDGKPPAIKNNTLKQRYYSKRESENRYHAAKEELKKCINDNDTYRLKNEVSVLRKKIVKISKDDTESVKKLLALTGTSYYQCDGESDAICAYMVKNNKAYACLSEDTDLFVYGTHRVLRYLSLLKSTVVIYDVDGMLTTLGLTFKEFQDICVLSGSDYNKNDSFDFKTSISTFIKYIESREQISYSEWIIKQKYIQNDDGFKQAIELFDTNRVKMTSNNFTKSEGNLDELKRFLEIYGFIFAK